MATSAPPNPPFVDRARMAVLRRILRFPAAALPAPSVEYEAGNAQAYDDRRKGRDVFQWEERIVGELLSSLPKGSTVLDVPVGTGRFIPIYLEIGLTVTGLDLSDDMLAEAARTFEPSAQQVALRRGSATELPFPDQQFDALVSFRFLPGKLTLRQTRRALREYARVTRGNVYVLLKVGERKFPASWRDEFSCLATRPESDLREILRQEGLVVERIERAPRGPKAVFVCRRA